MEILVCARRVPDTSENEIELNSAGNDIERDELVYSINEPDNYAVEEALQITARVGGNVTVVTIGGEDDEEILRREMAMGVQKAGLISDDDVHWIRWPGHRNHPEGLRREGSLRLDSDRRPGR